MTQKVPQIYTANHATFPIRIRKITVQISGNFWVTQYIEIQEFANLNVVLTEQLKSRSVIKPSLSGLEGKSTI